MEEYQSGKHIVLRNASVAMLSQILYFIAAFICRTFFTLSLGSKYLGVNGLFTNILSIISFAELGITSASSFFLYAPVKNNDEKKIAMYIHFYRALYRGVCIAIIILGLFFLPFIPYFTDSYGISEDLRLIFLLYLIQTACSYTFVNNKSLLIAKRQDYIVDTISCGARIVMNAFQCIILVLTSSFIMYLLGYIIFTLSANIIITIYVKRRHPYLNLYYEDKLSREEMRLFWLKSRGALLTKVSTRILNSTDNIFIAKYIGLSAVGILGNYTLIFVTFNTLMNKIFGALTSSIGRLALDNRAKSEDALFKMLFINSFIYSYVCLGMMLLVRDFVSGIWLNQEYDLATGIILIALIELFIRSTHYPMYTLRCAFGFFSEYRYLSLIMAGINIILDFALVNRLGIVGLYLATCLCDIILNAVDIIIVYKKGFNKKPWKYLIDALSWWLFTFILYFIMKKVLVYISFIGILGFIVKIIIITLIYLSAFYICFGRTKTFEAIWAGWNGDKHEH